MNKLVELQIRPLHWVLWPTTYKHEWSSCAPTDTYYEFCASGSTYASNEDSLRAL
jgi:hypothetical protein